jgi:gliding motility associated protien GldN
MLKTNFVILFSFLSLFSFSQSNLLNADSPEEVGKKTKQQKALDFNQPLDYPYVDDKDILWSKIVYEYVDGYEQFNYPMFYPLKDAEFTESRRSLWRILREYIYFDTVQNEEDLDSIGNENKKVLKLYDPDYRNFNVESDINFRLPQTDVSEGQLRIAQQTVDLNKDGQVNQEDIFWLPSNNIIGYNLKGVWYFDKKYGALNYRLIGIQPIGYEKFGGFEEGDEPKAFFWLWFKDLREVLHANTIFSEKNNSKRITFDQLFISRKFHTYLYRIENIIDDRSLSQTPYIENNPYLRITESHRLKEVIRNFEHDMWSN